MARRNPLRNVILLLTIIIAIGAMVTIITFLIQIGIIDVGLVQTPNNVPPIAEIPFEGDDGTQQPESNLDDPTITELIEQFLRNSGVLQVETFDVNANIRLIDSNLEDQFSGSILNVQPLDPREVIVSPDEELDPSRVFIQTDFSSQLADNGRNFHQFSGWNIVDEPKECRGDPPSNCPVPVTITTVKGANCFVDNTGVCVQVIGFKNEDDDVGNASVMHGLQKDIDISDWTREGELLLEFDYHCDNRINKNMQVISTIQGDTKNLFRLTCTTDGKLRTDVSEIAGTSNTLIIEFGARATNPDDFRINVQFNNVELTGNSVLRRQAIELLDTLSIVQNTDEGRVLDLGFIEVSLVGTTVEPSERVMLNGVLETRINDKTISTHQVTGNGFTMNSKIPLNIDGQQILILELDEQFYGDETFHVLRILLNDFIVTVGEGDEQRTFEYHTPFVIYTLEFNVKPDEIVAFSANDRAISVKKSETIFETCGLTSSSNITNGQEILPPTVDIIQNGFVIATTNPSAGKVQATDPLTREEIPNTKFCSVIPDLPTGTELSFKVEDEFFNVSVPSTQKKYFIECDRNGCTSNIGYSSDFNG